MKQLVSQVKTLELVAECSTALEAYNHLASTDIDLLLLDIEMPEMTGLELTKKLGNKSPLIIFTTAKTDYAVEAFELDVVDYLVKPVLPARFVQAIEKAREVTESTKADPRDPRAAEQDFVFVKDGGVLKKINVEDILYLEAMGDYVKVYTGQRFYVLHATLKSIEEKLPQSKFVRVHRSYIVSLNKIETIQDGAITIGKASVPIADTYRTVLNKRLNLL